MTVEGFAVPETDGGSVAVAAEHRLARAAAWALGLNAVVGVAAIGSSLLRIALLDRVLAGDVVSMGAAARDEWREAAVGLAAVGAWLVCAVVFLLWLHRAYRAAGALRVSGMRSTPRGAVVSFFIPVVNLFRPYQAVRELHDGLDPAALPAPEPRPRPDGAEHYRASAATLPLTPVALPAAPVGAWWACWVASNMVSCVGLRVVGGADALALRAQSWASIAGDAFALAAAVLGVLVVRAVDARVRERHRRVAAG